MRRSDTAAPLHATWGAEKGLAPALLAPRHSAPLRARCKAETAALSLLPRVLGACRLLAIRSPIPLSSVKEGHKSRRIYRSSGTERASSPDAQNPNWMRASCRRPDLSPATRCGSWRGKARHLSGRREWSLDSNLRLTQFLMRSLGAAGQRPEQRGRGGERNGGDPCNVRADGEVGEGVGSGAPQRLLPRQGRDQRWRGRSAAYSECRDGAGSGRRADRQGHRSSCRSSH
jgi:hypothetical protein